ncbi:MAG: SDR family oxidoreductase [Ectothiorhodospiraceae bacterium]|nr:SDR family oxidoreductase [Ectothiorhodospiraceae bacterium]
MQRLLIAGCGDLGTGLGLQLARSGVTVYGLRRAAERVPEPIIPVRADLTEPESLAALPAEGVDAVCYIATPGAYEDAAYRRAYVDGLRNLLDRLQQQRARPKRLLFVSSSSVYGITDGSWVDEDTPAVPGGFSGTRLLEAETVLRQAPIPGVVVRFGGIYGPGRERLLRKVAGGDPVIADPPQWTNRIHRDDAVGVLAHLLQLPEPAPLYLGVDSEPVPMHAVTDWIADRLGLPPCPHIRGEAGGLRGSNKRCSNRRLLASGYRFLYPDFRSGYQPMIDAWKQRQRDKG